MTNWLSTSPSSGNGSNMIAVTALPNTGGTRNANVLINGNETSVAVSVEQKNGPYELMPMTFKIASAGTINWYHRRTLLDDVGYLTIQYRINEGQWTSLTATSAGTSFNVAAGDVVEFKGDNVRYGTLPLSYTTFSGSTAVFEAYGNTMSLIDSVNYPTVENLTEQYAFNRLFASCTGLTSAENLIMSTTVIPMHVYTSMFEGCTSLTTSPLLPGISPDNSSYNEMFKGCTSLNNVRCLATDVSNYRCTYNWLSGVSQTGTFTKAASMTGWGTGNDGIPNGWTVLNYDNSDWIHLGQTAGTGNAIISISADPNMGESARTTSITVDGVTKHVTVPIEQPELYMSISPEVYNFKSTGGTAEFIVMSRNDWSATEYPEWLTLSPTGGSSGTTIITATCEANTESSPRVSGITVYNSTDSKSASTIITQNEEQPSLVVTPTHINIPRTGGTRTFQVSSTLPWYISGSTIGTIMPSSGTEGDTTVSVTITDENTGNTIIKNTFKVYNASASSYVTVAQKTDDYLTFETIKSGRIYLNISIGNAKKLYYSKNGGYWTRVSADTSIAMANNDYAQFKMTRETTGTSVVSLFSGSTGEYNLSGNIMSLVDADNFEQIYQTPEWVPTALTPYVTIYRGYFQNCFGACSGITSISDIRMPATALTNLCYSNMFSGCKALTSAQCVLPATTLAGSCYTQMFSSCYSLTTTPELPATTLASDCYDGMFRNCYSLTTPPELPATTLIWRCYPGMFEGCTGLTSTPELPATTLAYECYQNMFRNCYSLTTPPELPATSLAPFCYSGMFGGCTGLTSTPSLPATTLAGSCYQSMFRGCYSLRTAQSILPAGIMVEGCYRGMFAGCSRLTTAPGLPATTLAERCYQDMFDGCKSLVIAPILLAETLFKYSYNGMFSGCTNLSYIKCMATDISASGCTSGWTSGVSEEGTFVKAEGTTWETGDNGIPYNWRILEM